MFGLLLNSLAIKGIISVVAMVGITTFAGCMIDKLGQGAANARELEINRQIMQADVEADKERSDRFRRTQEAFQKARERIAKLEEEFDEQITNVRLREAEAEKSGEIPLCPDVCRLSQ